MKKERLEQLSDGIFAIVMTLLVLELRVPLLAGFATNEALITALSDLYPLFLSYTLSFLLLFTYWRAHTYVVSVFAKNIDVRLSNYNALFFLLIGFVPFLSHLLGAYSETQFAVVAFCLDIIAIGVTLYAMRNYVVRSETIETDEITERSVRHGTIRTLMPPLCGVAAIGLSFVGTTLSLVVLTFAIVFNLMPGVVDGIDRLFFKKLVAAEEKLKGEVR
jgi:uncharacterized membrane protein